MATPSIGSKSFVTLSGMRPHAPAERLAEITRPRVDGHAFQEIGKRGQVVGLISEADVSNPGTEMAAYRALIKTFVTVTFGTGESFSTVLVLDVFAVECKKVLTPVGGLTAGDHWLVAQWVLLPTAV